MQAPSQFQVGDRISITKVDMLGQAGLVQYVGPLEGKEGTYHGVALDKPLGTHNGKFKDKSYFSCEDNHGIFIFEKYLAKEGAKLEPQKEEKKDDKKKAATTAPIAKDAKDLKPKLKDVSKVKEVKKEEVKKEESKKSEVKKPEQKQELKQQEVKKVDKPEQRQEQQKPEQIEQRIESLTQLDSKSTIDLDIEVKLKGQDPHERKQSREFESQQSTIELLKDELVNLKASSQALQAVNMDLKQQVATQKRKNEQLEEQVKSASGTAGEDEIHELSQMVEMLQMDNDNKTQKVESQRKTLESQAAEIKRLREEKELAELELEEAILTAGSNYESGADDGTQSGANQDMIIINGKLRQALQVMSDQLMQQSAQAELETAQYQLKLEAVPQLMERSKLVDKLQSQLKKANEEIEELSRSLDEQSSLSEMIEKLAESMMKKDEDILALKRQAKEMNELKKLNEEIIVDLEDMSKDQELQLKNMEFDLYESNRRVQAQVTETEERDQVVSRLKSKIGQLNKQLELMNIDLPLKDITSEVPVEGKAQEIMAKFQELVSQRRDMHKRLLNLQIENCDIRNEVLLKGVLLIRSIPQEYQSKLKFNLIDPLAQVRKVGEKSSLLADEFTQTLDLQGETLIAEENQDLGMWMSDAVKHLHTLTNLSLTMSSLIENLPTIEPVEKAARNGVLINQFKMAGSQVDEFIRLVTSDQLSSKQSISGLQVIIVHIQEDINSLLTQNEEFKSSVEYEGIQVRAKLQNLIQCLTHAIFNGKFMREQELSRKVSKEAFRLDQLVETVLKRAKEHLRIMSSYRLSWGTFDVFRGKNGKNYDQLSQYLVDLLQILEEKLNFETSDAFLTGQSNSPDTLNDQSYLTYRDRLISLAHVLNVLNQNLGAVGQSIEELVDEFSNSHRNTQSNAHVYSKTSVWGALSQAMSQQLQEIQFVVESEKRLKEEIESVQQDKMVQQNDMLGLRKAREALERRVVELQLKADRVQFLENEKRRFLEKIQGYTEASELTRRELENYETKCKELEEERDNLEQLILVYKSGLNNNNSNVNENAEKIISRSTTRMQTRLYKMMEVNTKQDLISSSKDIEADISIKIQGDSGAINKILWCELQQSRQKDLRQAIIQVAELRGPQPSTKASDAATAMRQIKSQALRQMASAKIMRVGEPAVEAVSHKQEAIKLYTSTMAQLNIETSKQYYEDRLLLQVRPVHVQKHLVVDKTTLINTLYEVLK